MNPRLGIRFSCALLFATSLLASDGFAATSGVILISTRYQQDTQFSSEFVTDEKGPGMVTPGDVAMASLLADNGYTPRLVLDRLLGSGASAIGQDPAAILKPVNTAFAPVLAMMSGSGASADTPPPPEGVPVMMGEHVCLGANAARPGSIFLYKGTSSTDPNDASTPPATKYMKVVNPDHPIMKGIPLDAQNRVKIFREPYPTEQSHVPESGKKNFEYRWCTQTAADAAPGTTILGVLDGDEAKTCFAVADVGAMLGNDQASKVRLVHLFLNENGSGGSRRVFNALTEIGRVLFLRAAQWAMGEELQPYRSFRILDVTAASPQAVKFRWEGSAQQNYAIQASDDLQNWSTVVEGVAGANGEVSRTLNLSAVTTPVYFRVGALP